MSLKLNLLLGIVLSMVLTHPVYSSSNSQSPLSGIWEMLGYGKIYEISESNIKIYDYTSISCTLRKTLPLESIDRLGQFELIKSDSLVQTLGITKYSLRRLNKLPDSFAATDSALVKNPKFNFDVFWHTLQENYPFFEKRNMNWQQVYEEYKDKITEETTDEELFFSLREITNKLGDEHTSVRASDEIMKSFSGKRDASIGSTIEPSNIDIGDVKKAVLKHYVKKPKTFGKDLNGDGLLSWGITKKNVGYIQLNNMLFFADYNIPDSLVGYDYLFTYLKQSDSNPNYQQDEVKGFKFLMDSIMIDFKNTNGIILDLRFNLGGYEVVSLELLSHFIEKETFVFSKKAKTINGFTQAQQYILAPSERAFTKPVFLLTSHQTSSAPESLALSSMAVKNITRIGSNTMGILSDALEKKLPNGWDLYLSNEVYTNTQGQGFESDGIPPDILIDYPKDEDAFISFVYNNLKNGDKAIELCIKLSNKKRK